MAFLDETGLAELWAKICNKHDGFVNEYVWAKVLTETIIIDDRIIGFASNTSWSVYMSPTISIVDGSPQLDQRTNVTGNGPSGFSNYVGKYFDLSSIYGDEYKCLRMYECDSTRAGFYVQTVKNKETIVGYVNSADQNAYPPAVSDGYTYTPLGHLGEKMRIETGSYTGTGTYGSSNPNSLTFGFVPQVLFISGKPVNWGNFLPNIGQIINNKTSKECVVGFSYGSDSGTSAGGTGYPMILHGMFDNKTITWFANSCPVQLNTAGVTYEYIAIG